MSLYDAPLDDPAYSPAYPPIDGQVPPEVARFGAHTQLRWFRRFWDDLRDTRENALSGYYVHSTQHVGPCCPSCLDDEEYGYYGSDGCCCRASA